MINITCTNCKTQLTIDDAFAGGVCRCQYCGTIQTVPSRLKTSGGVAGGQSSGLMDHAGAAPAGRSSADVGSAVGSRKASSKSPVEVRSPSKSGVSARSGAGLRGDSDNGGAKALYGRKPGENGRDGPNDGRRANARGSGLDELASVVASSGLTGSGLAGSGLGSAGRGMRVPAAEPAQAPADNTTKNKNVVMVLAGSGVVIVALLGIVIWLLARGSNHGEGTPAPGGTPSAAASDASAASPGPAFPMPLAADAQNNPAAPQAAPPSVGSDALKPGPAFLGIDLSAETSVIYVLDRGQVTGNESRFDYLKGACLRSLSALGAGRKFQVIFWNNNDNKQADIAFPEGSPDYATPANIEACQKVLDDCFAGGQSDAKSALTKALAANPSAIVLATAKSCDDDLTRATLELRKNSAARIHCLYLNAGDTSTPLSTIARQTGGKYREVSLTELEQAARQ